MNASFDWAMGLVCILAAVAFCYVAVQLVLQATKQKDTLAALDEATQRIEFHSTHDALTGLPNRPLLHARLQQAVKGYESNEKPFVVMSVDLDRFKNVNMSHGYGAGDEVIKSFAARLKKTLRGQDSIARMGDDEFVLLLPGCAADGARIVLDRLSKPLRRAHQWGDKEIHLTVSIGIALYPQDADNAETLLLRADEALHAAKQAGRDNHQFYSAEMSLLTQERLQAEAIVPPAPEPTQTEQSSQQAQPVVRALRR